jgi:hypothetical protein
LISFVAVKADLRETPVYSSKGIRDFRGLFCSCAIISVTFSFNKQNPLRKMASSGMLRRMALLRTDVSEERSASFIRVARIGELTW